MRQTIREGRDFPGGPVVEISLSNAEGAGSKPGWGSKIPHALWPKKKKARSNAATSSMKTLIKKNDNS